MEITTMRTNTLKAATYWISTGLVGLDFLVGGAFQIARSPQAMEGFAHLGYPAYFVTLLGVWKVLGAIVLLVPGSPRLKEWAYAGIIFDLTAAVVSLVAVGDGWAVALLPLAFVVLTLASWALRPQSRTLVAPSVRSSAASALTASVDATA
jgi:uncharacterized membrane protein YphA (DoxX/SURF4 family)